MSEATTRGGLPILHFADQPALERWLAAQPADAGGIWLAIAKVGGGARTVSKAEAIDSGLCFGWIDGQLGRLDERCFLVRFTPRRAASKWSQNNARRAEELLAQGRVKPGGLRQIEAANADGRWDAAAAEKRATHFTADYLSLPDTKLAYEARAGRKRWFEYV